MKEVFQAPGPFGSDCAGGLKLKPRTTAFPDSPPHLPCAATEVAGEAHTSRPAISPLDVQAELGRWAPASLHDTVLPEPACHFETALHRGLWETRPRTMIRSFWRMVLHQNPQCLGGLRWDICCGSSPYPAPYLHCGEAHRQQEALARTQKLPCCASRYQGCSGAVTALTTEFLLV